MAITGIGTDILAGYYAARANLRAGGVNASQSANNAPPGKNTPYPPWDPRSTPVPNETLAKNVLAGKKFVDLNAALLKDRTLDKDYNKMFALNTALQSLQALAEAADKKNVSTTDLNRMTKRFGEGLEEVDGFLRKEKLEKAKFIKGQSVTSATTQVGVKRDAPYYSTGVLHTGAGDTEVARFTGRVQFKLTATKSDGTIINKEIDLAGMGSTTRTMGAVADYINGELDSAGIISRFTRVDLTPPPADPKKVSTAPKQWGFKITGSVTETLTFAPTTTNAGTDSNVFVAGTEVNVTKATNTIGRVQGFNEASGSITDNVDWAKDVKTTTGAMNIRASATAADGSYYVIADVTGVINNQPIKGTSDVALIKYDSAGNTIFTRTLGAAANGKGFAISAGADGSVAIAGSVVGKLTTNDVGYLTDSYVAKFNADGEEVWARRRGSVLDDEATAVAVADDGSVIMGGRTKASISGEDMQGGYDSYIRKYDADGALVFTDQFGTSSDDKITALTLVQATAGSTGGGGTTPDARDAELLTWHDEVFAQNQLNATVQAGLMAGNSNAHIGFAVSSVIETVYNATDNAYYSLVVDAGPGTRQLSLVKTNATGTTSGASDVEAIGGYGTGGDTIRLAANELQGGVGVAGVLKGVDLNAGGAGMFFYKFDNTLTVQSQIVRDISADYQNFPQGQITVSAASFDSSGNLLAAVGVDGDNQSDGTDEYNLIKLSSGNAATTIGSFTVDSSYEGQHNVSAIVQGGAAGEYHLLGTRGPGASDAVNVVLTDDDANGTSTLKAIHEIGTDTEITAGKMVGTTLYAYGESRNGALDPQYDLGGNGSIDTDMVTNITHAYSSGTNGVTLWLDTGGNDEAGVAYFDGNTGVEGTATGGSGGGGGGGGGATTTTQTLYVGGIEGANSVVRTFTFEDDATTPTAGAVFNLGDLGGGGVTAIKGADDAIYIGGTTTNASLQFQNNGVNITTNASNAHGGGQDGFVARIDTGSNTAAVAFVGTSADDIISSMVLTGVTATSGGGGVVVTDPRDTKLETDAAADYILQDEMDSVNTALQGTMGLAGGLVMDIKKLGSDYIVLGVFDLGEVKLAKFDSSFNFVDEASIGVNSDTSAYEAHMDIDGGVIGVAGTFSEFDSTAGNMLAFATYNSSLAVVDQSYEDLGTNPLTHNVYSALTTAVTYDSASGTFYTSSRYDDDADLAHDTLLFLTGSAVTGINGKSAFQLDDSNGEDRVDHIVLDDTLTGADQRYHLVGRQGDNGVVRKVDTAAGLRTLNGITDFAPNAIVGKIFDASVVNGSLYVSGSTTDTSIDPQFDRNDDGAGPGDADFTTQITHAAGSGTQHFNMWFDAVDNDTAAVAYSDPVTGTLGAAPSGGSGGGTGLADPVRDPALLTYEAAQFNILQKKDMIRSVLAADSSVHSVEDVAFDGTHLYALTLSSTAGGSGERVATIKKMDTSGTVLDSVNYGSIIAGTQSARLDAHSSGNVYVAGSFYSVGGITNANGVWGVAQIETLGMTISDSFEDSYGRPIKVTAIKFVQDPMSTAGEGHIYAATREDVTVDGIYDTNRLMKFDTQALSTTPDWMSAIVTSISTNEAVTGPDIIEQIALDDVNTGAAQRYYLIGAQNADGVVRTLDTASAVTTVSGTMNYGAGLSGNVHAAYVDGGNLYTFGETRDPNLDPQWDAGDNGTTDTDLTTHITHSDGNGTGASLYTMWIDMNDKDEAAVAYFDRTTGVAGTEVDNGPPGGGGSGGAGTTDASAIYIGGSTGGALAGNDKTGSQDGFFGKLTFDGTDLNIEYTKQFGRTGTKLTGVQVGVSDGSSDLAKLGLPSGTIDYSDSKLVTAASSARVGDHFYVKVNGRPAVKVAVAADETMRTLATKVSRILSSDGKAEARLGSNGTALNIKASKGDRIELIAGAKGQDLLRSLSLTEGVVVNEIKDKNGNVINQPNQPPIYALRLPGDMRIDTKEERAKTIQALTASISAVKRAYRESRQTPEERAQATKDAEKLAALQKAPSGYMQGQISNYQQALARLQGGGGGGVTSLF